MAEAKARIERPLSPHLQIYRWTWTMAMSIVHRVTGVALYAGALLLAGWLLALASGPHAYDGVARFFGSVIGRLILFGYTWALMHHLLGGVRHLVWDFGYGMEPGTRMDMARFTLIGSVIGRLILFVYTFILMQHLVGGIRHLIWDFGYGMEPGTRMNMARATPIAAAILTLLIWVVALLVRR